MRVIDLPSKHDKFLAQTERFQAMLDHQLYTQIQVNPTGFKKLYILVLVIPRLRLTSLYRNMGLYSLAIWHALVQ